MGKAGWGVGTGKGSHSQECIAGVAIIDRFLSSCSRQS